MTFAELKANVRDLRDGNESELPYAKYSDTDLEELFFTSAKKELRLDLISALKVTEAEAETYLNEVTDKNPERLKTALAYKQLEFYFLTNDRGDQVRTEYYRRKYALLRDQFATLRSGLSAGAGVSIISFTR